MSDWITMLDVRIQRKSPPHNTVDNRESFYIDIEELYDDSHN